MKVSLRIIFVFCFLFVSIYNFFGQTKLPAYLDYIDQYSNIAIANEKLYKIPASITLAQGIFESGAGGSFLAKTARNHFGVKCGSDWTGEKVYKADDGPNDCFRKYKAVEESYADHGKFLQKPRYAVLFTYNLKNYTAWAKGLQSCGYATNPGYANKLIQLIEDYELYKYNANSTPAGRKTDKPVLNRNIYKTFGLIYVIADDDDSFDQISKDTRFKVSDLVKFNEVSSNFPLQKGDIVYLETKKTKADKPNFEHIVAVGESVYRISQLYGIQLKQLYKMNKLSPNYVPTEGDVLQLR